VQIDGRKDGAQQEGTRTESQEGLGIYNGEERWLLGRNTRVNAAGVRLTCKGSGEMRWVKVQGTESDVGGGGIERERKGEGGRLLLDSVASASASADETDSESGAETDEAQCSACGQVGEDELAFPTTSLIPRMRS